jgi:anti-sigma B factor antagonist
VSPRLAGACPAFMVTVSAVSDGVSVVAVSGELDWSQVPQLRQALRSVLAGDGPAFVVLDLSGLEFTDSSGLGLMIAGHQWAKARGGMLALAAVPRFMASVLRVAGLTRIFPPYATVGDARAALLAGGAACPR